MSALHAQAKIRRRSAQDTVFLARIQPTCPRIVITTYIMSSMPRCYTHHCCPINTVKLADFGTAVQLTFQRLQRNTLAGTPYYMAPELIQRIPYKEKVDIWSVGITILELMTGRPPFYHLEPEEALEAIVKFGVNGLSPKEFSGEICDFTNRCCLSQEPSARSSARDLLKHTFINKACTKFAFAQALVDITKHLPLSDSPTRDCIIL